MLVRIKNIDEGARKTTIDNKDEKLKNDKESKLNVTTDVTNCTQIQKCEYLEKNLKIEKD